MSVFIWLLVHLSKEYFYTTEYHLNYTQVPWGMKMLGCSDSTLILTIRLQGFEFFSEQFFRRKKRECDVSLHGMKMKIGEDQVNGYLLTRGIAKSIAEQTTYPLEIYSTSPDTIFFTFDKKSLKRMTSIKSTSLSITHNGIDSGSNHPDSIRVKVPRSLLTRTPSTKRKDK